MNDIPISTTQAASLVGVLLLLTYISFRYRRQTTPKGNAAPQREEMKRQPDWEDIDFSTVDAVAADFDWRLVQPKPYRPWNNGPHYITMGLKKSTLQDLVEIDHQYLERYHYKRHLFAEHPEKTVQFLPGSEAPSFEALYILARLLVRRYPSMFAEVSGGVRNLVVNETWDLRPEAETWKEYHPLQVMGLLTTEDWFILQTDDEGQTKLTAGANCFPAGWKLQERIGLSLWEIHAGKVPQYEKHLSKSMDRFFLRLRVDSPMTRYNYAIDKSGELFNIEPHHNLKQEDLPEPVHLEQLHLRVERQFLQRLPKTKAIMFSIRTYITPITEVTKDKERALALQTSVDSYSEELSVYKNKTLWKDVLGQHLKEVLAV